MSWHTSVIKRLRRDCARSSKPPVTLLVECLETRDLPTVTVVSGVILNWSDVRGVHSYNIDATVGQPISLEVSHTPVSLLPINAGRSAYTYANARTPEGFWWDESLD